jgi:hypothetical protein
MTTKRKQLVLALVLLTFCLLSSYWGLMTLIHGRDARDISEQIAAAHKAAEKMPVGLARGEDFVRQLKAIDPGRAHPEVKQALNEYVAAMEQSLQATKMQQDPAPFERVCADKAQRLTKAINNLR